jgi:hypothetical protein
MQLFIGDSDIEIHTEWEIINSTFQTYGKNNIIDKIKEFLEITLSHPYTHKIKILNVHVNGKIYQPKQYRYLRGIKRTKYYKNKDYKYYKEYVQYLSYLQIIIQYKFRNRATNL